MPFSPVHSALKFSDVFGVFAKSSNSILPSSYPFTVMSKYTRAKAIFKLLMSPSIKNNDLGALVININVIQVDNLVAVVVVC